MELKKEIENTKRSYEQKFEEARKRLGIELSLDQIVRAKPNSKEMQQVKYHREAMERAETLFKNNKELERKVENLETELDENRLEMNQLQEKYS